MNEQFRKIGVSPVDDSRASGDQPGRPLRPARGLANAGGDAIAAAERGKSSLALAHMRAILILMLVAFHSVSAYLGFLGPAAFSFDDPPYGWRAFPIVDSPRWFGFDIFCAWQDVYLMALMFLLSGLFAWPSLVRKGGRRFLRDRLKRLGAPYLFGVILVAPLALYPAYRVTAADPDPGVYWRHFLALPFWPNGPMWFLCLLMALTAAAAGLWRLAPGGLDFLGTLSARAAARPGRYFVGLSSAAALAYAPLALAFTPWEWAEFGPISFQMSRPLLYAVYYFAGLGIGASGLERGLLAVDGLLARRWRRWLASALVSFLLWMGLTALTFPDTAAAPRIVQLGADLSFAVAGASSCFFVLAACLRFGATPSRWLASVSNNAFGIYLLHYPFVVWLQYALLGWTLWAIAKGAIVFTGAAALAWSATNALRLVRFGSRLIGEEPRAPARAGAQPAGSRNAMGRRRVYGPDKTGIAAAIGAAEESRRIP